MRGTPHRASALLAALSACAPPTDAGDTGLPPQVELWQGGERIAWNTDSEATTRFDQVVAVEPEPFELHFAGCDLRVFATDDLALLDTVQPMADHPTRTCGDSAVHRSFHGFHVGAAGSDMDHLFLNTAQGFQGVVSALHEAYAARPVPGRPGWCRQTLTQWWAREGGQSLDGEPVSLLLWSDTDGDGQDDEEERSRWTLEF